MGLPTPEDIIKGHRAFTSTEPTEVQKRLYNAFPARRGPLGSEHRDELFEAVLVMALVQTVSTSSKVYFFVPASTEGMALEALKTFAERVFAGIKQRKAVTQAKAMGKAFKAILLGHRVLQMDEAPERWVAYGFAANDPMPAWLAQGLVQD